jgi:hypothetical protein
MENSMVAPQKTNKKLPYDLAILLAGVYRKECKPGYNKVTCTLMFIAVFFTTAKLWK